MEYLYCPSGNYEDYASGRVIYGAKGIPNFPVRLIAEIFGRALEASCKKDMLSVYDPCCGGAYSLTIIGFFYGSHIQKLYGSDISEDMLLCAKKNLNLLTYGGLDERRRELETLFAEYGKESHSEAIRSAEKLRLQLGREIASETFVADCTKTLPDIKPDIIITDIPYGNLVDWGGEGEMKAMLDRLWEISGDDTILAVSMDKNQKVSYERWKRIEKQNIGKRRFEILRKLNNMNKKEKAVAYFEDHLHCSQSVLAAFAEECGITEEQAFRLGSCFGSGMRRGNVCGACTGALMVLGLMFGENHKGDPDERNRSNKINDLMLDRFERENGTCICNELLGCDISTPEGVRFARETGLFKDFCPKMVASAVDVLESVIEEMRNNNFQR